MSEKQSLVEVFRGDSFNAEIIRSKLESFGIGAMIRNNSMSAVFSSLTPIVGDYCVLVAEENREEAIRLIEQEQ